MFFLIYLAVVFILFAILFPTVFGTNWSSERVAGYRIGMVGACTLTVILAIGNYFFPVV